MCLGARSPLTAAAVPVGTGRPRRVWRGVALALLPVCRVACDVCVRVCTNVGVCVRVCGRWYVCAFARGCGPSVGSGPPLASSARAPSARASPACATQSAGARQHRIDPRSREPAPPKTAAPLSECGPALACLFAWCTHWSRCARRRWRRGRRHHRHRHGSCSAAAAFTYLSCVRAHSAGSLWLCLLRLMLEEGQHGAVHLLPSYLLLRCCCLLLCCCKRCHCHTL